MQHTRSYPNPAASEMTAWRIDKVETRSLQEWPGLFNPKKVERSRSDLVLTWVATSMPVAPGTL